MSARMLGATLVIALLVVAGLGQPPPDAQRVRIVRVVDGDTAVLLRTHEYVRYLGIDTPEAGEPYYQAATRMNRQLVLLRDVYLEFGPQRKDAYGRLLAYLWVQRDGEWILVNEELLRRGVARLYVLWPPEEKYYDRFLWALTLAQVEKRALWSTFPDPLPLAAIEDAPVTHLTQAVTVVFAVGQVEERDGSWYVYAMDSRFGFHLVVWPQVWAELGLSPQGLVGRELGVTGELRWERLAQGPFIEVLIPEQWTTP